MAITKALRPLDYKTGTFCWDLRSRAIFWLPLLVYVGVAIACNYFSLFIDRFGVLYFSFVISYNLLFFDREIDVWRVTICTIFYPLFHSKVTSNSILSCSPIFHFRVTSNSILPCSRQLRNCNIFFLMAADDIFVIRAIDERIKPLLNILENDMTSFYNSLPCPNTCFNTGFWCIVRIFSFLLALFLAQVLLIQT